MFFLFTSRKFLGYVISAKGIEVNPNKVKAIMEMPPPHNIKKFMGPPRLSLVY